MEHKNLIQEFLYPTQHIWAHLPVGFIVNGNFPANFAKWYVDDIEKFGNNMTFDYSFPNAGQYRVKVWVQDGIGGYDSKECDVIVDNQTNCDEINFMLNQFKSAIQLNSGDPEEDRKVNFNIIDPGPGKVQSALWEWGDGKFLNAPTESDVVKQGALKPSHPYSTRGEHYGIVKICTPSGCCERHFFVIVG